MTLVRLKTYRGPEEFEPGTQSAMVVDMLELMAGHVPALTSWALPTPDGSVPTSVLEVTAESIAAKFEPNREDFRRIG